MDSLDVLYDAIWRRCLDDVRKLLNAGVDPNAQSFHQKSPLNYAITLGNYEIADELAKKGANCNERVRPYRWPLLMKAVHTHNYGAASRLLLLGADPNLASDRGQTALHLACKSRQDFMVELLLSYGANPNLKDSNGISPAMMIGVNPNSRIAIKIRQLGKHDWSECHEHRDDECRSPSR